MMNNQKQTPRLLHASIKPNRLHHHPRRRRKSALRRLRLFENARLPPRRIKTTNINPLNAVSRQHRSKRRNLKRPLPMPPTLIHPQTQRIVVINHSLKRTDEIILSHSRRNLQQHRLVKPIDPTTTLQQPAHDRRRHNSPSGDVRQRRRRLLDQRRYPSQPRYRLMLKHRSWRDHQARFAGPAHQLDRDDAVAPKRKEVVLKPNPRNPQYLRKKPTQDLLLRRARQTTPTPPPILRRRQRAAVQLPVRRQRKTIKLNNRGRNHVIRQPRPDMRTQRTRINLPPRRRNNIADKLRAARAIRARNNRSLRYAPLPKQRRLDLPRLNPKPADLHLLVRATHKLQNPIKPPARQVPAAVHPTPQTPIPIRNKALRSQPPTTQIAPTNPNRNRLQTIIQNINTRVPNRMTNWNSSRKAICVITAMRCRPDATLSWAILIYQGNCW